MRISDWSSDVCSSDLRERISASPLGYKRFARHSRRQGQRRARQLDQPTPQLPLPPPACARLSCRAARNWCGWTWSGRPAAAFSALAYVLRMGGCAFGGLVLAVVAGSVGYGGFDIALCVAAAPMLAPFGLWSLYPGWPIAPF